MTLKSNHIIKMKIEKKTISGSYLHANVEIYSAINNFITIVSPVFVYLILNNLCPMGCIITLPFVIVSNVTNNK